METKDTDTQTNPLNNIGIFNLKKKKVPIDIKINNSQKQPKVVPNVKYSAKHNFRRYKSKTEPKLHEGLKKDEEDDIIHKIREAFGLGGKENTNYSDVITAEAPEFMADPVQPNDITQISAGSTVHRKLGGLHYVPNPIDDITSEDYEELSGQSAGRMRARGDAITVDGITFPVAPEDRALINSATNPEERRYLAYTTATRAYPGEVYSIANLTKEETRFLNQNYKAEDLHDNAVRMIKEREQNVGKSFKDLPPMDAIFSEYGQVPVDILLRLSLSEPEQAYFKTHAVPDDLKHSYSILKEIFQNRASKERPLPPAIVSPVAKDEAIKKLAFGEEEEDPDGELFEVPDEDLLKYLKNKNKHLPQKSMKDLYPNEYSTLFNSYELKRQLDEKASDQPVSGFRNVELVPEYIPSYTPERNKYRGRKPSTYKGALKRVKDLQEKNKGLAPPSLDLLSRQLYNSGYQPDLYPTRNQFWNAEREEYNENKVKNYHSIKNSLKRYGEK